GGGVGGGVGTGVGVGVGTGAAVGLGEGVGPLDSTRLTGLPLPTPVPAVGKVLITSPAVWFDGCDVTRPRFSPLAVSVLVASSRVCPSRSGTLTCWVPLLTTMPTLSPACMGVPATGSVEITWATATVSQGWVVTSGTGLARG